MAEAGLHRGGVKAGVFGAVPPLADEGVGGDAVVLGCPAGEGCRLPRPGRAVAGLGEQLLDLIAALAELVDHAGGHARDVGPAVADRAPADAEARAQKVAEVGLVEVSAGKGVLVERATVERPPGVERREREVGDHDVGVEQRVAGAAGAVVEGGGDHAVGQDLLALAAPVSGLALEVRDHLVDGFPVGLADRRSLGVVAERPEDRHALGRPEREVEAGAGLRRVVVGGVPVHLLEPEPPDEAVGRR